MKLRRSMLAMLLSLSLGGAMAMAADAPATAPGAKHLKWDTYSPHISSFTYNKDGTILAIFETKDKQGNTVPREVLLTKDTIINYLGDLKDISFIKDSLIKEVVACRVCEDGRTCILIRWGRTMLKSSLADLSPGQRALLTDYYPVPTQQSNDAYEARIAGFMDTLKIADADKASNVKKALWDFLTTVREAHNAEMQPAPSVRDALNKTLAANLSPAQVSQVKDLITGGQLDRHMRAYHIIVPTMTADDDKAVRELMTQAREAALFEKSEKDMVGAFQPFKDKAEAYFNAHGYDWHKLYGENSKKVGQAPAAPAANQ